MKPSHWGVYGAISLTVAVLSAASDVRTANVTIDDADTRVIYSGVWNNQNCNSCSAKPNASLATDGTWHDGTQGATDGATLSASLTFSEIRMALIKVFPGNVPAIPGTDIYVLGILGPAAAVPAVPVSLNFFIDGIPSGSYTKKPPVKTAAKYHYNVSFFAGHGLTNESHTLTMTLNKPSFVLLDSFVYTYVTTEDSPHHHHHQPHPPPGPPPPQAAPAASGNSSIVASAVGGAVGGTFGVIALAGLAFWYFRNRREQPPTQKPYPTGMSTYAPGQSSSPGTDRSSRATTLAPGLVPAPAPRLSDSHNIPFDSSPSHHVPWAQYSPESHSPLGAQVSPWPDAPHPSSSAGPLSRLFSPRSENPPPGYAQPGK
ncbi:hypothetical protein BOTBODRAFT_642336 [Botryobasidium botryosum FD-172 SS1]|uniref:Uncharacterized protein n=1 Tax=Botryobasidium botryosum (strain FD-172 SS1) TaxID=930990 RepID=A0A067M4L0_BOTB1|nr:hypothetical protein BOTBODRAFT_642336 [Botryobasidium botryosum FD-172 SS1]